MELLTGLGLATASGLNAYIPLLALGLLSRFTDLITLPHGWVWLENGWVMGIVAVLLVVEIVADKIPALDSVNDAIQTFVRPTSGGIVFGSGAGRQVMLRHMRKTPKAGRSGMGAFRLADSPSASTRRVSAGSITPSSHRRALA